MPLAGRSFKGVPHPSFHASVKICRPDKPVVTVFLVFCPKVLPTVRGRSDLTGPEVELVTYKVEDLLWLQF